MTGPLCHRNIWIITQLYFLLELAHYFSWECWDWIWTRCDWHSRRCLTRQKLTNCTFFNNNPYLYVFLYILSICLRVSLNWLTIVFSYSVARPWLKRWDWLSVHKCMHTFYLILLLSTKSYFILLNLTSFYWISTKLILNHICWNFSFD